MLDLQQTGFRRYSASLFSTESERRFKAVLLSIGLSIASSVHAYLAASKAGRGIQGQILGRKAERNVLLTAQTSKLALQ